MTLYPQGALGQTSVDALTRVVETVVARVAPDFEVARNVHGVEVRPRGIDKGSGARRIAELLDLALEAMAGVGDSDPDLAFLDNCVGFSAAPSNATPKVRQHVMYVANGAFGDGLLEIVALVEQRNRQSL